VQVRPIDQPGLSIRRVHAVINPASGGVGRGAAGELAALFAELGLDHQVSELVPGRLENAVRTAIDAGPDLMVVLGGDGTARLVAELCGPHGPLVAPLSGGTMNKLGRALYGAKPWREALVGALTDGEARWMPGGEVGGHAFYCRAVLGSPALWARAREEVRARKLGRAWRRAVIASRGAFVGRLRYEFDGKEIGYGLAVGLICPTVSRALGDEEGALEAAVLDLRDTKAGVRLALNNMLGDWRDDPDVTVRRCVSGRAWARDPIPAMLDGEFFRLGRLVETRFRPRAFRALAPRAAPAETLRPHLG
jgi:diacylglycerol kinase family enzyme